MDKFNPRVTKRLIAGCAILAGIGYMLGDWGMAVLSVALMLAFAASLISEG